MIINNISKILRTQDDVCVSSLWTRDSLSVWECSHCAEVSSGEQQWSRQQHGGDSSYDWWWWVRCSVWCDLWWQFNIYYLCLSKMQENEENVICDKLV